MSLKLWLGKYFWTIISDIFLNNSQDGWVATNILRLWWPKLKASKCQQSRTPTQVVWCIESCKWQKPGVLVNLPVSPAQRWRMYSIQPVGSLCPSHGWMCVCQNALVAAILRWKSPGTNTTKSRQFFEECSIVCIFCRLSICSFVDRSPCTRITSSLSLALGTPLCLRKLTNCHSFDLHQCWWHLQGTV